MPKIRVKALPQEVADWIREMIRRGSLKTGERLVEQKLCQVLGVSRTPLREALRALHSEGLVDLIPRRGAFVSQPGMDEIRDMFEVMGLLEGACARWAAERMTDSELRKIERLHEQLERHYRNRDAEAYIRTNHAYHSLLQELSGNRTIHTVLNGLRQKLLLHRFRQLYQPNRFDRSIEEHRRLLRAFRDRDADAAERCMREHLHNQCEALVTVYEEEPDSGGTPGPGSREADPVIPHTRGERA